MFDINFFETSSQFKDKIVSKTDAINAQDIAVAFEKLRSRRPFVFNIETTTACNMKCIMCPRPSLMKRPIIHMDLDLFEKIINQLFPHTDNDLEEYYKFIAKKYSIFPDDRNENSFYFYTSSKSLTLHGFGEPLLDPLINERIKLCAKRGIPTYMSCVPANINVDKVAEMMRSGLGVLKCSLDALDDKTQKKIRGNRSDFTNSYRKICELIDLKSGDSSIKTKIVVTMLALSNQHESKRLYKDFMGLWKNKSVYAYIKSQDNRWFFEKDESLKSKSHYESQYCEFPWISMTVMADGSVVPCTQDYNCEMVLGNANSQSLEEIWNSDTYANFRNWHLNGDFPKKDFKCTSSCDIKIIYDRLQEKNHQHKGFC